MKNWMLGYIEKQVNAVRTGFRPSQVWRVIDILDAARKANKQIFVIGNGGSASNASHFATDLGKSSSDKLDPRFKVMSLNDNIAWITAISNDYSYDDIFWRQLENYANPGDILMTLGVSGNSPNIIKAAKWAKKNGLFVIGFMANKGGKIENIADECFVIDDTHYGRVEDIEMMICHIICYYFIENYDNDDNG